jgi:hypothetical protein
LNGLLDLQAKDAVEKVNVHGSIKIRPLDTSDWEQLPSLFAGAFQRVQPFVSLCDTDRELAAQECLAQTRNGGDGPLIREACFVAQAERKDHIIGGILITLIPRREEGDWWTGHWDEPPPPDAVAQKLGRPHLTWVFVGPWYAKQGIGSALLAHSVNALLRLGYRDLASTFLVGNDSSTLWHWRNGFRLVAQPGSRMSSDLG